MSAKDLLGGSSDGELRAITINGAIHVESSEDAKKRQEKRKARKSRWEKPAAVNECGGGVSRGRSSIVLPDDDNNTPPAAKKFKAITCASSSASNLLSTSIDASNMSEDSQQAYFLRLQIQDASVKLARPDLGIPVNPRERSPSPEPIYNSRGIRINTREERTRSKLINQRNSAITKLKELDPTYQPSSAYNYKNTQLEDKVMIPADEHPHINFVGLLLGPRGNSLEEMKTRTKCNIIIRGKGSLRSGMTGITKDGKKFEALDEPLHAWIQGQTAEDVQNAVKEINELVEMQIYNPDCEKAVMLRSKHMHELAVLNGTLRSEFDMKCLNCGRDGHKAWQCGDGTVFTSSVICSSCGGVGHLTKDCRQRRPGAAFNPVPKKVEKEVIDKEYSAFLKDLTGKGALPDEEAEEKEKEYVPPMGDLSKLLDSSTKAPLRLTHSSATPGAESARVRAITSGQHAGGSMRAVGQSIFGGKMTTLTAGFKSQSELERERQKKKDEAEAGTPVPLQWQVERFEKQFNKRQDEYMKRLQKQADEERNKSNMRAMLSQPPPPPPPGSRAASRTTQPGDLPKLIGTPMDSLKKM